MGMANDNPILDTRKYIVEFPDGCETPYMANLIAENMITQCDANANQCLLFRAIIDHKYEEETQIIEREEEKHQQDKTRGWTLAVEWKDGSTSWERIRDLKESFPIEVADYAVANNIHVKPAFSWWVKNVLRRCKKMIGSTNAKYIKRTHRFGLEIPKTVKRALEIDAENGSRLWQDAIAKEMEAVRVAFKILDDGKLPPPGYQRMECHMIFDIKLDGFRRKARLVAGGHQTEPPASVLT